MRNASYERKLNMSQQDLKQSLSALIDSEADELELRRVLNASHEPELRDTWSRYQVARAAMHNEPLSVQVDLSASIMAAIDAEPRHGQQKQRRRQSERSVRLGLVALP